MNLAKTKKLSFEQQRRVLAEAMWLSYFNQTLYEQGVITESERNRVKNMISGRNPFS